MTLVIDGQLSIFDILGSVPPAQRKPAARRQLEPPGHKAIRDHIMLMGAPTTVPTPALDPRYPVHCVYCGEEQTTWMHLNINHGLFDVGRGWTCTAMGLTSNHVTSYARQIKAQLAGQQAGQCCYSPGELHGKVVRKPTIMQLADHLRERIDNARKTWGIRAAQFDEWLGPYLVEHGLLKYSLDPAEYPWEFEGGNA